MLNELWQTRQRQHLLKMLKYLKYIFNDHFVLVLLIFLGFLMINYANFILALTPETGNILALKFGLLVYFLAGLSIGRLATLLHPADSQFLSVLEKEWDRYFLFAKWHSMIMPTFVLVILFLLTIPIFMFINFPYYYLLLGVAVTLKWIQLSLEHYLLKQNKWKRVQLSVLIVVLNGVLLGIFLFISPVLSFVIGILGAAICHYTIQHDKGLYRWDDMISYETKRQNKLFRMIQLFVDVPLYQEMPKKRTYLNRWLRPTRNMHQYLMERLFLRASHYLGLTIRLTIIEMVMQFFIPINVASLIGIGVAYITAFQLLPLYTHYDNEQQLLGWPLQIEAKKQAFQKQIKRILMGQLLVSHIFFSLFNHQVMIYVNVLVDLIFIYFILPLYIGRKIDKM